MAACSLLLRPQRPSTRPGVRLRSSPLAASPTAAKTPLLRDRRRRHHLLHTPQLLSAFLPLLLALVLPSGAAGFSVSLPSTPAAGDKRRTSDAEPSPTPHALAAEASPTPTPFPQLYYDPVRRVWAAHDMSLADGAAYRASRQARGLTAQRGRELQNSCCCSTCE